MKAAAVLLGCAPKVNGWELVAAVDCAAPAPNTNGFVGVVAAVGPAAALLAAPKVNVVGPPAAEDAAPPKTKGVAPLVGVAPNVNGAGEDGALAFATSSAGAGFSPVSLLVISSRPVVGAGADAPNVKAGALDGVMVAAVDGEAGAEPKEKVGTEAAAVNAGIPKLNAGAFSAAGAADLSISLAAASVAAVADA